jgi:hypothetical protein
MKPKIYTPDSRMDFHQARTEATQEEMKVKMNINQGEIKDSREEIMADMKTQIGCLASRINVNQEKMRAKVSVIQHKIEATMKCSQKETKAAIYYVRPHLEETIKDRAEAVLAFVD